LSDLSLKDIDFKMLLVVCFDNHKSSRLFSAAARGAGGKFRISAGKKKVRKDEESFIFPHSDRDDSITFWAQAPI